MTSQTARLPRFFYRMPPRPCPYLEGRTEQNIFTELTGANTTQLYDALTQAGFRRSHNVAYRPSCPGCQACVPVRVAAQHYEPSRSQLRIWRVNADLVETEVRPEATAEQYALFTRYLSARHADGEMAGMTFADYVAMIEDSPLSTSMLEYRDGADALVAACLVDRLADGLSAVYSFFEPSASPRSPGSYMIMKMIERCRHERLPYLYLGYWIDGSRKMAYKARFRPLEGLTARGWTRLP